MPGKHHARLFGRELRNRNGVFIPRTGVLRLRVFIRSYYNLKQEIAVAARKSSQPICSHRVARIWISVLRGYCPLSDGGFQRNQVGLHPLFAGLIGKQPFPAEMP
jgi:hypothetical protein